MKKILSNLTCSPKKSSNSLDLVGFFLEDLKKLNAKFSSPLLTKQGFTLISEEKKIYYCLGKKKAYSLETFLNFLPELVSIQNYKISCALDNFVAKTAQLSEEVVLKNISYAYYFYNHQDINYKSKSKPVPKVFLHLVTSLKNAAQLLKKSQIIANAVNLCRDWQNQAPNLLHSESFAQQVFDHYKDKTDIECQILDKKTISKEKMNLLLAVNAGSQYQPRVVVLKYLPLSNQTKPVVLIGKGITFDTGGYSLKPANYQLGMKFDMSGSAVVLATMQALVDLKIKVNVIAIACITDNAIGKKATLVESVVVSKSGKTVEITNTDAEGRLVVADGISYAFAHYSPQQIVELSTLTGAISVTLGDWCTGAFSNNDRLYQEFFQASKLAQEPIWRLPVTKENFQNMKSPIADLVNAHKGYKGSSSNAAAFLFSFVEKKCPFLHLDIAGTATKPENIKATGVMVKSLINFFLAKKNQ